MATTSTKLAIAVKATIAYPSVAEMDDNGKYSALAIIDDADDIAKIEKLILDQAEQTFGSAEMPQGAHNPLRDADERKADGEFSFKHPGFRVPGAKVVRVKSGYQPKCFATSRKIECDPEDVIGGDLYFNWPPVYLSKHRN